jgi:lysine biosynthesis protein LysW
MSHYCLLVFLACFLASVIRSVRAAKALLTSFMGEILSCPECGLELEVKQVNGSLLELQELTIEGEDWGE